MQILMHCYQNTNMANTFTYKMVDTRIEMIFAAVDAARTNLYRAIQAAAAHSQDDYCRQFLADAKASLDEANKLYREMEIHIGSIKDAAEGD